MRLFTFIIALLLLGGSIEPTRGWLIALTVVSGLAAFGWRSRRPYTLHPSIDLRIAPFVIAVLLLAGTVEPTRDWLIGLSIAAGVALVMPRMWHFETDHWEREFAFGHRHGRRWRTRWSGWDGDEWR
jgi:hypothetical protein